MTTKEKNGGLTQASLKGLLRYDAEAGKFYWLFNRKGGVRAGDAAGFSDAHGRVSIRVDGILYYAHRLVWLYMHGRWPFQEIDHKNCDAGDNRLDNLREATSRQNKGNMRTPSHNRSGSKGAYEDRRCGRWYAQIARGGKQVYLGRFDTQVEAHDAYVRAATDYFGEFARGE